MSHSGRGRRFRRKSFLKTTVTTLMPYCMAVESSDELNMNPPSPARQTTGRLGPGYLDAQGGREGIPEIEGVARVDVRLGVIDLEMGPGVVAELRNVPDRESLLRNAPLDRFEDGVLGFLEPDVIVGYEVAGGGYRLCR